LQNKEDIVEELEKEIGSQGVKDQIVLKENKATLKRRRH
jgi:hypothetical protein